MLFKKFTRALNKASKSSSGSAKFTAEIVFWPTMPSALTPRIRCGILMPFAPEPQTQSTRMLATFCDWIWSAFQRFQKCGMNTRSRTSCLEICFKSCTSMSPSPSLSYPHCRHVAIVTPMLVAPPESAGSFAKPPSHLRMNGKSLSQLAIFVVVYGLFTCPLVIRHENVGQRDVQMSFRLVHHDSLHCLGNRLVILG